MFNFFNMNLRPMMDEDGGVGGASAAAQTGTEGTGTSSTGASTGSATGTEGTQGNEGTSGGTEVATQKRVQTPEENAFFADSRRKLEAAEKRANEVESLRKRDQEIARKYGKDYNVYSDADVEAQWGKTHGIKTVAEFEAALEKEAKEAQIAEYKEKGIDPDIIKKIVDEHPDIKKARENNEAAAKAQQDRFLVDSFNELSKEYPDIKNVEDVPADVWKKWNGGSTGLSLTDAFYVVNRKEIIAKQADAAKQATLNNIQGKSHVRGNGSGTEVDTTTIPDDVLAMYKRFNPGKTMDEYKAHYKKSM